MDRAITVLQPVNRILPLCASSLETLVLLCDSIQIVGHTPECSSPQWITSTAVVNNYPLDIEKVLSLKPDLIVSKEGMMSMEHLKKLESLGLTVYMQRADNIDDIASSIQKLGEVIGRKEKGEQAALDFLSSFKGLKPSAIGIISSDPIYVYGNASYLTDLLSYCGLDNAIEHSIEQLYPVVDQEYLISRDPDFLIFGGNEKRAEELFNKYPALKVMKAYRNQQLLFVNDDWISRPGPELAKAAGEISKQLNHCAREKR